MATNGHAFDVTDDARIRHTKFGLWDVYEDSGRPSRAVWPTPKSLRHSLHRTREQARALTRNMHYVWKLVELLRAVPSSALAYLFIHFLIRVALPPLEMFFAGRVVGMLEHVRTSEVRNPSWFGLVFFFNTFSGMGAHYLRGFKFTLQQKCIQCIQKFFLLHMMDARVRLDMPTFADPAVSRQLDRSDQHAYFWRALDAFIRLATMVLNFFSAIGMLVWFCWRHPVAAPLAAASAFSTLFMTVSHIRGETFRSVWAATNKDPKYVQLQGYQDMVRSRDHKQEVLMYNLGPHLIQRSKSIVDELGDGAVIEFRGEDFDRMRDRKRMMTFDGMRMHIFRELPYIVLSFLCIRSPEHIPMLLGARHMIKRSLHHAEHSLRRFSREAKMSTQVLTDVKAAFEVSGVENKIKDGVKPFPENAQETAEEGIEIEFRNVSFKYPMTETWALKDVSFKIQRGQLAVIVGFNGSGKSTVLKLLARLYDPTEGEIFIDGRDIKTIRIADLRECIAALFQNFTIFPLSIRENVGLGDAAYADDEHRIQHAMSLAGVDFEDKLGRGYDTYLTHPVLDHFSNLPEGTETIFGQKVNYQAHAGFMTNRRDVDLSGGQEQKVAVARTMMRMTSADDRVGLLLFDEPSASMDPVAEHNLFETLRRIRRGKTMLFSTHRYGNLVQHANTVLFMQDGKVVEQGTHGELVRKDGSYAVMWKLQAQAFLAATAH